MLTKLNVSNVIIVYDDLCCVYILKYDLEARANGHITH